MIWAYKDSTQSMEQERDTVQREELRQTGYLRNSSLQLQAEAMWGCDVNLRCPLQGHLNADVIPGSQVVALFAENL